jgi:hypothetical protein
MKRMRPFSTSAVVVPQAEAPSVRAAIAASRRRGRMGVWSLVI